MVFLEKPKKQTFGTGHMSVAHGYDPEECLTLQDATSGCVSRLISEAARTETGTILVPVGREHVSVAYVRRKLGPKSSKRWYARLLERLRDPSQPEEVRELLALLLRSWPALWRSVSSNGRREWWNRRRKSS